jgi:hypothetical protein
MASYDANLLVRAFVETVALREELPAMPLFLEPGAHIVVPLEASYRAAFDSIPLPWQRLLERASLR